MIGVEVEVELPEGGGGVTRGPGVVGGGETGVGGVNDVPFGGTVNVGVLTTVPVPVPVEPVPILGGERNGYVGNVGGV
jgi:hypothetical protein